MEPAQVLEFYVSGLPDKRERFREMIHKELDKFLDQLMGVFEEKERPTLSELSDMLTQTRQDFLGACLQHLIEEKYSDTLRLKESTCPHCGKVCRKKREIGKKVATMQGPSRSSHSNTALVGLCHSWGAPFVRVVPC